MDIHHIKTLNKTQLLGLFNSKDINDRNEKRGYFSDVFYDFSHWPLNSIRDFWLIRRVNRMRLTNFCFGNGLSLNVLYEMIEFYHENNSDNQRRLGEMVVLWDRLKKNEVPDYYFYSMELGFEMYFNGKKRVNGQPGNHVQMGNLFNTVDQSGSGAYTHLSPAAFERKVREEVASREDQKHSERQELIRRSARKKQERREKTLEFLKLKSVEDFFIDDVDED